MTEAETLRERLWSSTPWSDGVELVRLETHVIPSRGRAGRWVLDEADVLFRGRKIRVVLSYAPRVQPAAVPDVSLRLSRAMRDSLANRFERRLPALLLVVDVATESLLQACRRERLGLIDFAGTLDLETDETLIQISGHRKVERPLRVSPSSPLGTRVIRALLLTLDAPLSIGRLAAQLHASYSSVWSAVVGLEKLGLVARRRSAAPRVLDPRGLLKHWCEHGVPPIREGWFCPNTTPSGLREGLARLQARGADALFTYRSALSDAEVHVAGLPHGLRSVASAEAIVESFGLRPVTPHNFFIVRDQLPVTGFGGPGMSPRAVDAGQAVSLPQLVFDLHHAGGRATEQAEASSEQWWKTLPARPLDD